jgi:hypothetical protein
MYADFSNSYNTNDENILDKIHVVEGESPAVLLNIFLFYLHLLEAGIAVARVYDSFVKVVRSNFGPLYDSYDRTLIHRDVSMDMMKSKIVSTYSSLRDLGDQFMLQDSSYKKLLEELEEDIMLALQDSNLARNYNLIRMMNLVIILTCMFIETKQQHGHAAVRPLYSKRVLQRGGSTSKRSTSDEVILNSNCRFHDKGAPHLLKNCYKMRDPVGFSQRTAIRS